MQESLCMAVRQLQHAEIEHACTECERYHESAYFHARRASEVRHVLAHCRARGWPDLTGFDNATHAAHLKLARMARDCEATFKT